MNDQIASLRIAGRPAPDSAAEARNRIRERGWAMRNEISRARLEPYGAIDLFAVETLDGAIIQFYSTAK